VGVGCILIQFYLRDGRSNAKYLGISHTCLFQRNSVEKTAYKSNLKKVIISVFGPVYFWLLVSVADF